MKEYYFKEIDSTQDYAKKLCSERETEFLVYADIQTSGRGRNGHKWNSPLGGLWFSFDMGFTSDIGELFTIAVGVAVREVLSEVYNSEIELKWPNDLIFERKKVGGIICEKIDERVIIGIGINTNAERVEVERAVSFFEKTGGVVDNYEVMGRIIQRCRDVMKLNSDSIVKRFGENLAYRGERCFVSMINQEAKILDITDKGHLIVETDSGKKEVSAGEISVCI